MVDDVSQYQNLNRMVTFETRLGSAGAARTSRIRGRQRGQGGALGCCVSQSLKLSVPNSGKGEGCSSSARSPFAARQQSEEFTPPETPD